MPVRPQPPRLAAVARAGHAQPVAFEEPRQEVADLAVIVHHQDVRHLLHAGTIRNDAAARQGVLHSVALPCGMVRPYKPRVSFPHPPPAARAAIARLTAQDPDLAAIEAAAGPLPWRSRPPGFPGLLQAIVAQQISNQAAAAIWGRLRAAPGALDPEGLLALSDEALRAVGLSRPKAAHARSLAAAFVDRRLDPWRSR